MKKYSLFQVFGIEAEYMVVDQKTLKVLPLVEYILKTQNEGELEDEIEVGDVAWSNELVAHVVEIKCNGPKSDLVATSKNFHQSILTINDLLKSKDAILLPTAMHPLMNPDSETKLWPYGQKEIYQTFDAVFGCKGHGWSNLQSVHINLPFLNETEFGKLHAAIRIVLPLIPVLAASSPMYENKWGEHLDCRLMFYEKNQARVPAIIGKVIPEAIFTFNDYQKMLENIYKDISVYDKARVLQHPWLNSRGAILKSEVGAIEIRVMDIQECPYMDFSIISFIIAVLKSLVKEEFISFEKQKLVSETDLKKVYDSALIGPNSSIELFYQNIFKYEGDSSFNNFLNFLFSKMKNQIPEYFHSGVLTILNKGNLSTRIKKNANLIPIEKIYRDLAQCLVDNKAYE